MERACNSVLPNPPQEHFRGICTFFLSPPPPKSQFPHPHPTALFFNWNEKHLLAQFTMIFFLMFNLCIICVLSGWDSQQLLSLPSLKSFGHLYVCVGIPRWSISWTQAGRFQPPAIFCLQQTQATFHFKKHSSPLITVCCLFSHCCKDLALLLSVFRCFLVRHCKRTFPILGKLNFERLPFERKNQYCANRRYAMQHYLMLMKRQWWPLVQLPAAAGTH